MKLYSLKQEQFIKADIARVWSFFSSPQNLNKITPPYMRFEIIDIGGSGDMKTGQLITYKVSPLPFMRVKWITEISDVQPLSFFADQQKRGPFALWHHQHKFTAVDGGVQMHDEVTYSIPFGILGAIANAVVVQRQVRGIFEYRRRAIEAIFHQSNAR